ncbi:MAG: protein-tyrosine-phosphatase [Balneola sp.]
MTVNQPTLFKDLKEKCIELEGRFNTISEERKIKLNSLSSYISSKIKADETPQLVVICTHNSRRSHMGQLWLALGASYYGLPEVLTYSGGTEATAFHPNAVNALRKIGFKIDTSQSDKINPAYKVTWTDTMDSYTALSTKFDEAPNPTKDFAAIMVCSEADQGCPFVPGCDFRLSLPFNDPKEFDGTDIQDQKYSERCEDIGTEMLFVMSKVAVQ